MDHGLTIGIDARLLRYRRGIGNFVFHTLAALAERRTGHVFVLYTDDASSARPFAGYPDFRVRLLRPRVYPVFEQLALAAAARSDRLDILYCPANSAPLALPRGLPLVLTIHDVMYMMPSRLLPRSPSMYQRLGRAYLRAVVPANARRADAITTVSAHSAADMAAYLDCPQQKITVIAEAAGPVFRVIADEAMLNAAMERHGIARPFLLTMGAIDPRKNTAGVLQAFRQFRASGGAAHQLVITGLSPGARTHFSRVVAANGLATSVVLTGFVPEEDLACLYNAASMFVYPTLYEGFGVPLLEAMACGTPVIAAPSGAVPEVAGDAALMVAPLDPASIAGAMRRIASEPELSASLVQRGHLRTRLFTWQRTAERLLAVLEDVRRD